MGFSFFYADIEASQAILNKYTLHDWVHSSNGVVASKLRGGLINGCNIRFLYLVRLNGNYRIEDMDYKNQGVFIFEPDLYFRVLDKFQIGNKAQILMSPTNDIAEYDLEGMIREARADFRLLHKSEPVGVLNTPEWKNRVALVPGFNGKITPHKQS